MPDSVEIVGNASLKIPVGQKAVGSFKTDYRLPITDYLLSIYRDLQHDHPGKILYFCL